MVALLNRSTTTNEGVKNLKDIGRSVMKSTVTGDRCLGYWLWLRGTLGSWLILGSLTQGTTFDEFVDEADIPGHQ